MPFSTAATAPHTALPSLRVPSATSIPSAPDGSTTATTATGTARGTNSTTGSGVRKAAHACGKCGTIFTKSSAKFCARCGTKKSANSSSAKSPKAAAATRGDVPGSANATLNGGPPPPRSSALNTAVFDPSSGGGAVSAKPIAGGGGGGTALPPSSSSASATLPNPSLRQSSTSKETGGGDQDRRKTACEVDGGRRPPLSPKQQQLQPQRQQQQQRRKSSSSAPPADALGLRAAADETGTFEGSPRQEQPPPSLPSKNSPAKITDSNGGNGDGVSAGTRRSNPSAAASAAATDADTPSNATASTSSSSPSTDTATLLSMGSMKTLVAPSSVEEEAQYSAWATLGPEGLTPDMLQTRNSSEELSSWRKGSLIGRGTYGSVFLGLLADGSFYAVKCVELGGKHALADLPFNIRELVSLSREISMMQRLRHRNLCSFKGVLYDADSTSICMFMQYVGGGSLSGIVKRFKPLPPGVIRRWTRQLLTGLLYLHSQHIIHRDIKGENVLIDTGAAPDSEAQVKLVDFGAARRLTDAVAQSRTVIGTPYWMAPEVVDVTGEGKGYSYKADVWSVGCTVAEMLTGRPPWPAKPNAASAIMMVASTDGMPTEVPRDEASEGCYQFMLRCFVRDPEQRPTVEGLLQHPWILGEME